MSDPYASILQTLNKQVPVEASHPFGIGKVVSSKPLKVRYGDLILDGDNLKISESMKKGYYRQVSIKETIVASTTTTTHDGGKTSSPHVHKLRDWLIEDGKLEMNSDLLESGDDVFLIGINDNQLYIILAKVVDI